MNCIEKSINSQSFKVARNSTFSIFSVLFDLQMINSFCLFRLFYQHILSCNLFIYYQAWTEEVVGMGIQFWRGLLHLWRHSWHNGCCCCKKWSQGPEFKSWTRMFPFHIALTPLGKVWIQLFSSQLWVNSREDCTVWPCDGNQSRRRKTSNSKCCTSIKYGPCFVSCLHWRCWVNRFYNW